MVRLDMGQNKSLAKAPAVLETLAASPRPLTAVRLSQQLTFPSPTLYRILDTLRVHDFLTLEGDGASYRLSFKVLDLSHQLVERTDLLGAARPALRRLHAVWFHPRAGVPRRSGARAPRLRGEPDEPREDARRGGRRACWVGSSPGHGVGGNRVRLPADVS